MEEKERYRLEGFDTNQGLVDKIYDTEKDIIICSVGDADDVDNVIELLNQQDKKIHILNEQSQNNYEKYTQVLKENQQLKQQIVEKEKTIQSHEKIVEQKEIKKWKVYYDEESWKESRFYTTDIYLGLAIQYLKKRSKIGEIIGCTGIAGFLGSLFGCIGVDSFGSVYNIVLACIAGVSIILGVLGLCISLPADSKWSDLISIYENSKEYEDIYAEIAKEQKEQQDKINAQKAKDLVEAYDILDNKEKTQEERIDLIKKYIK